MLFESSTRRFSREICASSREQHQSKSPSVNFTFEFAVDETNIYQNLCDRIIKELDFTSYNTTTSALVLTLSIPSASKNNSNNNAEEEDDDMTSSLPFVVNGDAQLRTALMSCTMEDTINISVSTRRKSNVMGASAIMSKGIQVACTLLIGDEEQEEGAFRYRFFAGQENLLENFKEECMDALDLFGSESSEFGLYFKLDGEWIPITGDRAVLEVLSMLTEAGTSNLETRLTQTPPKAPSVNLSLRCIFEGTLREVDKITVSEDNVARFLDVLTLECKGLWDLTPDEEITLYDGTVPPTDFQKEALIGSNTKAERVVNAAKATHEKALLLRMERGNQLPTQRKSVSTHIHVLYLDSDTNKFEQEAEFDFAWDGNPSNYRGAYTTLADKIRSLLHLTVPFDLFLGADAKGEIPPQSVKTDAQVFQFLVNAPATSQLFCVKNSLHQEADDNTKASPLPVGRASYLRAMIQDWRQILPRQIKNKDAIRINAEEMKPIIATWHLTYELKRREIVLLQKFEEFSCSKDYIRDGEKEGSLPIDELFSVLMRWTSYLVDDEVAHFARHCQNMIDYVTQVSNEARCNRLSARCFSALRSIGSVVKPELLVEALVQSGTVNRQDAENVVEGYSADGIEPWEFDEILTYFFLDESSAFQKMLGACSSLRTTPDYSQHDTSMKAVRENRLRSELRHALDGVVPTHLVRFAKVNWGLVATGSTITVPQNFLDLAWCVSALLNHSTSQQEQQEDNNNNNNTDRSLIANESDNNENASSFQLSEDVQDQKVLHETKINCWKWFIGECASEEAAANLLLIIRSTGLSFCSDDVIQRIGITVYNDGLDARLLHVTAGSFLSDIAQWCYVLQDLTFLVRNLQLKVPERRQQQQTNNDNNKPRSLNADEISPEKEPNAAGKNENNKNSSYHHRVKYSPPRATMGLRPTPPTSSVNSPSSNNTNASRGVVSTNNVRASRIMSPRSTMLSAGYGLNGPTPETNLNELLRLQKEENLLREFDGSSEKQQQSSNTSRSITMSSSEKKSDNTTQNTNPNNAKVRNNADFALFTIKSAGGLIKHPMLHSVDSYVVAYDPSGTVVHQTPVVEGTTSPVFPTTSRFIVPLSENGSVVFHILTESNISGFLGEVTMKLGEALYGGTREVCLKVKPRRGETDELLIEHSRDLGHLTVEVVPLKEPIFLPKSDPQGFLVWGKILGVDRVGVPEPGERRDFFVQVLDCADRPVRRTDCSSRDPENPKWNGINREFILPLDEAMENISLKLIDEDLKGGRVFGVATLPATSLIKANKEQREQQQAEPQNDEYSTQETAVVTDLASTAAERISKECTMTITARVLGPLPDDLSWRKRHEEARRLAQARAEEHAEEQKKREAEALERMLEDQAYIQAAEREAEKQRAARAENEKRKDDDRRAKLEEAEKQAKIREVQQKAKQAALEAAEQEEVDELSQRRQAQKERAAAAEADERKRMAAIDEQMQKNLTEDEIKERIRQQLEKEDADLKKREAEIEAEKKERDGDDNNNNNNNGDNKNTQQDAEPEEEKSQQEIAESAAKSELMKAMEEEAERERQEQLAKEIDFLETQEETPRRENLTKEFLKETEEITQQMMNEQKQVAEANAVAVEEEPPVTTAATGDDSNVAATAPENVEDEEEL